MRKSVFLRLLFVLSLLAGQQTLKAQKQEPNILLGGNLILGFPSGDFSNGYSYATGLDASLGIGFTEKLYLVGTMGYLSYKNKDDNLYGKIRLVPVKAGIRIYATKSFFLAGNAGVGFIKDGAMTSGESRFVYDAGVGLQLAVLQAGFYYDGWKRKNNSGTSNTFQVRLGIILR